MNALPTLTTARLTLRPFRIEDAPRVQQLAGAPEVALTTLLIPHPYPDGAAEEWISSHAEHWAEGTLNLAVDDGQLVGAISLRVKKDDDRAEIGYWIGLPYWRRGYATESVAAMMRYAFEALSLNKVYAGHFAANTASGAVMAKNGMKREGRLRQHVKKSGQYQDVELYSILRTEWQNEA